MGSVRDSVELWDAWKRGERPENTENLLARYETVGEVPQDILARCLEQARETASEQKDFFIVDIGY